MITPALASAPGLAEATSRRMDEDAFRIFYESTSRPLFGYLFRVTGRRDLAEDLLQESYCRLLSADLAAKDLAAMDLAAINNAETRSYLFKIATNLMRDHWRREKSRALDPAIEEETHEPRREAAVDLRAAFSQLKERERQILWLAYVEGSSHKEIAKSTGLRSGSIRLLLFRARKKMANVLRGRGGDNQEANL